MKSSVILLNIVLYIPLLILRIILFLNYLIYTSYIRIVQLLFDLIYNRNIEIGDEHKRVRLLANVIHDVMNYHVDETSNSRLIGMSLFKIKGNFSLQEVKTLVRDRIMNGKDENGRLAFPTFRQVVRYKFFLPTWIPANGSSSEILDDRIEEITLTHSTVRDFVSNVYTTGIPCDEPLWKIYLIRNQVEGENASFYLFYIGHHCVIDGFAFIKLWLCYISDTEVETALMTDQKNLAKADSLGTFYQQLSVTIGTLFFSPIYLVQEMLSFFYKRHKLFVNRGNGIKFASWDSNLDFEKVRFIKNQTKTSVNDVFMTILTQALEKYSKARGKADRNDAYFGMGIVKNPFNSVTVSNSNYLATVVLLPLGTEGFHQQLQRVNFNMDNLKRSFYPFFIENTVVEITALPLPLCLKLPLMKITGPTVGNFANLPGPKTHTFVSGHEIEEVAIFVPQAVDQTMGVCFLTYAGKLSVAVHVDSANFPNADEICEIIRDTLDEVYNELSNGNFI